MESCNVNFKHQAFLQYFSQTHPVGANTSGPSRDLRPLGSNSHMPYSGSDSASRVAVEALQERLASLESRLIEQDRTIRHTLTMLIEWIEGDDIRRTAA